MIYNHDKSVIKSLFTIILKGEIVTATQRMINLIYQDECEGNTIYIEVVMLSDRELQEWSNVQDKRICVRNLKDMYVPRFEHQYWHLSQEEASLSRNIH